MSPCEPVRERGPTDTRSAGAVGVSVNAIGDAERCSDSVPKEVLDQGNVFFDVAVDHQLERVGHVIGVHIERDGGPDGIR